MSHVSDERSYRSDMTTSHLPAWRLLWAKTDRDGTLKKGEDWTRPLWAHLLDVAHTALLLWDRVVPDPVRQSAAQSLGMDEREAGYLLSLYVGLHDWGKSVPSFQHLHPGARETLENVGLRFSTLPRIHHGHATIALWHRRLKAGNRTPIDRAFRLHLGAVVGYHHGQVCAQPQWEDYARDTYLGRKDHGWTAAQDDLFDEVVAAWTDRYPVVTGTPPENPAPDWLLGMAGWATYADWLGSIATCFPPDVEHGDDLAGYLDGSRAGAELALTQVGLAEAPGRLQALPFGELFKDAAGQPFPPRALQRLVLQEDFPAASDTPTLTIIEAPTGEGKTEAALALAARQQALRTTGGGLYLALPTQATSNGLFDRATAFLARAHSGGAAGFRLAHGHAQFHPGQQALLADPDDLASVHDGNGVQESAVRTLRWFLSSKRALLAPYGLGTVDQAMAGVLRSRHFFLRLYGLAGKTVVFDEVHAYDGFMRVIVVRLLGWLRALGAHVVILSATLPARLRADLMAAWDPGATTPDLPPPAEIPYPAVWTVASGRSRLHDREGGQRFQAAKSQHAALVQHDPSPDAVAATALRAAQAGAVVGVIVNTVRRAQEVFEAIQDAHALDPDDLWLFHARFVLDDRQRVERAVLERFGKGRGAGPAVLVATQVAEQSLDLDFDVLLTDLAPIDLVLQRAGRLHRHVRPRPAGFETPTVHWLCPDTPADGLPGVRDDFAAGFVYDPVVLWRTWRLLRDRPSWSLPDDYRPLIEAAYPASEPLDALAAAPDGLDPDATRRWDEAAEKSRDDLRCSMGRADTHLIPEPGDLLRLLAKAETKTYDEDDEDAHPSLRAVTREGDSVEVAVLYGNGAGGLFLDARHEHPAPLAVPAGKKSLAAEAVRALLGRSVRLSQKRLVHHLREIEPPAVWADATQETPALRYLRPLVVTNGVWADAGYRITPSDRLGLVVEHVAYS